MPLYEIQAGAHHLEPVVPTTFAAIQWRERQELQALLRDNPDVIDPDILIVSEEFSNWQESLRRVDLLALDKDANLIVIELKRVEEGGHMELQAIRYAAMLSGLDFEAVVTAFESLLSKPEVAQKVAQRQRVAHLEPSDARRVLLGFLGVGSAEEVIISSNPRILLLSPSFSKEITTTVLWLNDRGLDVRCLEVNPYQIENGLYLNVEQVIPLPSADTYIVQQREKATKVERQATTQRREKTLNILVSRGVLTSGMRLHLIRPPRPELQIDDDRAKHATFIDSQHIRWDYDDSVYSISSLCRAVCEQFGGAVGSGSFAGPDYWAIEGETVSLSSQAQSLSQSSQAAPAATPPSAPLSSSPVAERPRTAQNNVAQNTSTDA
jgi:hypothetical protein